MILPPDWQARMAAVIRGAAEPDPSWFSGGPTLSPLQQIGVYRQQYRLRIYDALVEEVPGTVHLLGEGAEAALWRYLDACPPHTWTLNRVADRLPAFLAGEGQPPEIADMARLDVGVAAVFEAAAGAPLSVERIASGAPLRLAPHVCLLRLRSDVHLLRSALLEHRELPAIQAREVPLVLFRRGIAVRHLEVAPELFALLERIGAGPGEGGQGLAEALEAVILSDPARLVPEIGGWFRLCGEAGWLQEAEPTPAQEAEAEAGQAG